MSAFLTLSDIAQELTSAFGESNVIEVENGPVTIGFDRVDVVFLMLPNPAKFLIAAGLGDLPANEVDHQNFCERLLRANTCFLATGGFTLSYLEGTGVILQGKLSFAELEHEGDAKKLVENFLDVANYWKDQCELKNGNDLDQSFQDDIAALLNTGIRV